MKYTRFKVLVLGVLVTSSFALHAGQQIPSSENLNSLAKEAAIIAKAVCQAKRKEMVPHPTRSGKEAPVLIYTFKTVEVIKGEVGSEFEVKQWGVRSRREAIQFGLALVEGSRFDVGKEYLLMLSSPSEKLGFRVIVGESDAGKFEITKDAQGKEMVVNPQANRGLFQGISKGSLSKSEQKVVEAPPGPLPYEEFSSLLKKAMQ